ncbi:MAG: hypothetical protein ACK2TV_01335 [Anaerolineales bacterium]
MKKVLKKLPGWIGIGLITFLNGIWLYWGMGEAFYEGWGVPDTPWFLFLSIGIAATLFSLLAIRYPYIGGGILIVSGIAFALWWIIPGIKGSLYSLTIALERLFLSGGFTLVGLLFILDAKFNPRTESQDQPWALRHMRPIIAIGIPMIVVIVVAAVNLPVVLTRVDDGIRTARLIEGNDIALIWAPEGPGWNWKQAFGGYPSWNALASYGITPLGLNTEKLPSKHASQKEMILTGLCAYLDVSGKQLMTEPQNIWRMPTVDEIARSLSLHNENAGCQWNGEFGKLDCQFRPDKETPLWAPDEPPVYYWAAGTYGQDEAYFVSYTGFVNAQPKDWGNPRHGYRCVKEP